MSNEAEPTGYIVGSWLNDLPHAGAEDRHSSVNGSYEPGRDRLILGSGDGQLGTDQPRTSVVEDHFAVDWSQEQIHDDGRSVEGEFAKADKDLAEQLERLERTHALPHQRAEKERIVELHKQSHTVRTMEASALRAQRERNAQRATQHEQTAAQREVWLQQQAARRADEMEVEEIAKRIRAERNKGRGY